MYLNRRRAPQGKCRKNLSVHYIELEHPSLEGGRTLPTVDIATSASFSALVNFFPIDRKKFRA
jgi:hypothetical protein